MARSLLLAVLLAVGADASPFGVWDQARSWKHPGWSKPAVYTPVPAPESDWPDWGWQHHTSSEGGVTSISTHTATSTSTTSSSSLPTATSTSVSSTKPFSSSMATSTSTAFSISVFTSPTVHSSAKSSIKSSIASGSSGTASLSSATMSSTSIISSSKISACPSLRSSKSSRASSSSALISSSSKSSGTGTTASITSKGSRAPSSGISGTVTGTAPSGSSTSLSPCASISKLVASASKATPSTAPTVPAMLGYQCLNSIPFNQSAAVQYLDSLRPYLEWQTTTEYIKSPPAEYAAKVQPPYDFTANFERIYGQAVAGTYKNEYTFGFDLYTAFQMAHDGHFVIYPDSVTALITFGRRTPIVSVSLDGESIPQIYAYEDVLSASFGNTSFTPSPIVQINGVNSVDYLLGFAERTGSLQDPDALWNNVFYSLAQVALGPLGTGTGAFSGGGRGRLQYPGQDTTLGFANGTNQTTQNFARVNVPFTNIQSGADLYRIYLTVPGGEPVSVEEAARTDALSTSTPVPTSATTALSSAAASSAGPTTTLPIPGYPTNPVIREMNNLNAGYFLEGEGYEDVAVLAVNSFVGAEADELPFQAVNTYLINQAVANNKTKLIIDVSANGGGTILQGYDLFKQLFPSIDPYGAQRFRAHEAIDIIGEEFSAYAGQVDRSLSLNDTAINIVSSPFNYRSDLDVNGERFTSWPEKYGPHAYGPEPDNFTSLFRWNLSDVLTPINSGGIYVSGYLNRSNITTQPFAAENIVVVTDGYCASTCTIFSELMRQQGGVKYVALGGRPNTNITQAVGGVKGTNDLPYDALFYYAEQVFLTPQLNSVAYYNTTILGNYTDLPLLRSTAAVVNARDGLRQGDETETPLQFVYEPADCRIFYTPEMTIDISASWRAVADSAFRGINHCVAGALGTTTAPARVKRHDGHLRRRSVMEKRALEDSVHAIWQGQGVTANGDGFMII